MQISDWKRQLKELYLPSGKEVSVVNVPGFKFLMVDGKGAPAADEFQKAVRALYGITFTLKFLPKKGIKPGGYFQYKIPPLEALWWTAGGEFDMHKLEEFIWTAMIMQPDFVTAEFVDKAKVMAAKKHPEIDYSMVRLADFAEGKAVQIMHIGPYSAEAENIQKLQDFATANNWKFAGRHHEIYLSDPNRTKPEKLKTVLRHPVA